MVNVHRITTAWQEDGVTWRSFAGGYDRIVIGTFGSAAAGWKEVDVTSLVRGWLNGTIRNCGLLLDDPGAGADQNEEYDSSECEDVGLRPRLEVCLPAQ